MIEINKGTHKICRICRICKSICRKYAANMCRKYPANMSRKYAANMQNMQKMQISMLKICCKYAENMLKMC
jgi:hypothetical protein